MPAVKHLPESMLLYGFTKKAILFSGGRLAAAKGIEVIVEVGPTTYWIIENSVNGNILYTFGQVAPVLEHVQLTEESFDRIKSRIGIIHPEPEEVVHPEPTVQEEVEETKEPQGQLNLFGEQM